MAPHSRVTAFRTALLEVLTHVVEPCVRTLLGVSGARAGAKRLGAAA